MNSNEMNNTCVDLTQNRMLQKPNIYNAYSPFNEYIKQYSCVLFDEIRENLSRTIQQDEFYPGFFVWSTKLKKFILLYGFNFTKIDHLKLIDFYLSILSITDLSFEVADMCFQLLYSLMRKTRLITRDELTIDWKIFYRWTQLIHDNHDKNHSLVVLPKDIDISLAICVRRCSPYFSTAATQEILDELRPKMCPTPDWDFLAIVKIFEIFLPVNLPQDLHNQGFRLWLSEFFGIWENIYNQTIWEGRLVSLFSALAWYNIGYIDWEPWLPQIFTRILRGFSLPIGKMQIATKKSTCIMSNITKWIVAMIGNKSSCIQHLRDFLIAIKSFFHPSNTGKFQEDIIKFLLGLIEQFVDRLHLEQKIQPVWFFAPLESYRLTEEDIIDFVNCVKECVFISIFNKNHTKEAAEACHYLSILKPELIVPSIVEKHFASIDSMTEPHRFTSIMTCLTHIARQIVQQTTSYSQGQTYVLPLLMSVLPGIDLNDYKKTSITFEFLDTILMLITCVDCSPAVNTRNDLTDIEKEVCLSTAKFEDFIMELLDRIIQMAYILSAEMSDATETDRNVDMIDSNIASKLTSITHSIVQQCSIKIFQKVQEKITKFLISSCLSPKVRDIASSLVRGLLKHNPAETLKYLLPKTFESLEKIMNNSESPIYLTDHKEDIELTWYLFLFAELLSARGDTLLIYKNMIMSIFHRCIPIINKKSYEIVANAATRLLESLTHVYPTDYRLTVENINEPFTHILPIRTWGQYVDIDKLQVHFHNPNEDEIDFASEFVNTFIYSELDSLNVKCSKLSNNERQRCLTIIKSMAIGCFRLVPRIESQQVHHLISSFVPYDSKYRVQYLINSKELKLKENLRLRLCTDIGKLLDQLIENHSDDVLSIIKALRLYLLTSMYYGIYEDGVSDLRKKFTSRERLLKNKLCGQGQNIRSLIIQKMDLQIKAQEMNTFGPLNEIDKEIILKLFELSINRYCQIRRRAQIDLLDTLKMYQCSFQTVVDRIVELLNRPGEVDHDQIKGCLYILRGNESFFLPTQYSWSMKEKLWLSISQTRHAKKISTQKLIEEINKKICEKYVSDAIIQNTNQTSKDAAVALWRALEETQIKIHNESNQVDVQSYTNLMETLSSSLKYNTLSCGQQKMTMTLLCLLLQRQVPIPLSCIETFVDCLTHDNIELRKYAAKGVAAICRLQKPSRIYVEKSLEEILAKSGKPSLVITNDYWHPGDRDDNLWITLDDYKPAETQVKWEETCFLDKPYHGYYTWPKMIKYTMNKRERYTENNMPKEVAVLYNHFIDKNFIIRMIELMTLDEEDGKKKFNKVRFAMFKGLFRNFGLVLIDNFMEQVYVLIREKSKEKHEGSHRVAAEIVAGMVRGSKYWTLEMHNQLWEKLTPLLTEVCVNLNSETRADWNSSFRCSMANLDPRRMHRLIDFMRTLINSKSTLNTFGEISRWSILRNLCEFEWRIPSVWCEVKEHAKLLIDHPSSGVRERIALLLPLSCCYDISLFSGASTRQINCNQFIDEICVRLRQAIEIYEKAPLMNISNQTIEIDVEARRALNFIETVVDMNKNYFTWCHQPVKDAIIRFFPLLCEIESIATNDSTFKNRLTVSRLFIGMSYLNVNFLETLIQQLVQICTNSKWHARRAAIEFTQNMIFSNLFNTQPYSKQIHDLVLKCLFDEQLEVRTAALQTLSGLYQCGYIKVTEEDLETFRRMNKTSYFTKVDDKKVILSKQLVKRHGGILGLCAVVLASPYDIPVYVPDTLMLLCQHTHDPYLIQKSIKECLSEFRRTHHDSWQEHREKFSEDQLSILSDVLISHSYYA